jgi:electron transfer flavoprotein alpha subunit
MSVLVFIDHADGHIKKASLEALSYGAAVAEQTGTTAEGVVLGSVQEDLTALGQYGVFKIHQVQHEGFKTFDAQVYSKVLAQVAEQDRCAGYCFSNNTVGKALAPRLSVRLKAGLVAGAVGLPNTSNGFVVKKNQVFSGKAFAQCISQHPGKNYCTECKCLSDHQPRRGRCGSGAV